MVGWGWKGWGWWVGWGWVEGGWMGWGGGGGVAVWREISPMNEPAGTGGQPPLLLR